MTERRNLEVSLAEMDRKLRELQRELALVSAPAAEEAPAPPPAPPAPARPVEPAPVAPPPGTDRLLEEASARVAELGRRIEELARLRDDLERATEDLREEHRRAEAEAEAEARRAAQAGTGEVVIDAGPFLDIATLGAFEHALRRVEGVEEAFVRSFEGNRALLDVRVQRPIDVPAALAAELPFAFDTIDGDGETLTLHLKSPR